jgi:hypothetical protein
MYLRNPEKGSIMSASIPTVIKIWLLPDRPEIFFRQLRKEVAAAATEIPRLCVEGENDLVVLFPCERMQFGLGSQSFIEISIGSCDASEEEEVQLAQELADKIGVVVKKSFQNISRITSRIYPFGHGAVQHIQQPDQSDFERRLVTVQ